MFSVIFPLDNHFVSNNSSSDSSSSSKEVSITEESVFSKLTYAALGDSITHGTYLATPYPYLVGNILGTKKVYNYGINASTITKTINGKDSYHNPMVLRYMDMVDNADIISIMGGINDWIFYHDNIFGTIDSTEITTLYGALKIMCQGLKEKYPNSFIFFMTPLNSTLEKPWSKTPEDVGVVIKEVCVTYDIPVLDLYGENAFDPDIHSSDQLHPNQEFMNSYLAPRIAEFILENYK